MSLLQTIGKAIGDAADHLSEKSRRAAYLNRIRSVIRYEERAAEKEYLALGRYYYNVLRDSGNSVTEDHCATLDAIQERLDKAIKQLEQFYEAERTVTGEEQEEDGGKAEEITLDDVETYDYDPLAAAVEKTAVETAAEAAAEVTAEAAAEAAEAAVETVAEAAETAAEAVEAAEKPVIDAAEPGENDSLPFEG